MAMGRRHRHHVISFNPLWCFTPPLPVNAQTGRSSASVLKEPTSPQVSCMGQIKKCKGSRVQPATSSVSSTSRRSTPTIGKKEADMIRPVVKSIANMDVPLPVVKTCRVREALRGNLWARRCGGDKAEGVQLQRLEVDVVAA